MIPVAVRVACFAGVRFESSVCLRVSFESSVCPRVRFELNVCPQMRFEWSVCPWVVSSCVRVGGCF